MDPVIPKRADPPTRRPLTRRLQGVALLVLCWAAMTGGVFSGCKGMFTPAIPEPPDPNHINVIPNYSSPDQTLNTMTRALAAKTYGSTAWSGAFGDSSAVGVPGYHQFFDLRDLTLFQSSCGCTAPSDWGLLQEGQFYTQFLSVRPADNYQAEFTAVDQFPDEPPGTDATHIYRHYKVEAVSPESTTVQIIAIGYADLYFHRKDDKWVITRWDDHIDPAADPLDPYQLTLGRRRLEATQ
jgi:hypothetical protein